MAFSAVDDFIGIEIQELKVRTFRILQADIDTLCVIGLFEYGPINQWVEVHSWEDFIRIFGSYLAGTESWLQIYCFFKIYEGRRAVIIRVAHYTDIDDYQTLTALKASGYIDDKDADIVGALPASPGGDIDDVVTTITLADASAFPTSATGPDYILIESEQITYTGKTGNDLTGCTRGANGTTAAAHLGGLAVTYIEPFGGLVDARYEGAKGNDIQVVVREINKVSTITTAALSNGDEWVYLNSIADVEIGEVLYIDDLTNSAYVQVIDRQVGRVRFADAITGLAAPITTGATVVSLNNEMDVYVAGELKETHYNLSMWAENQREFIETIINRDSLWITFTVDLARQATAMEEQQLKAQTVLLTGGSDGDLLTDSDFVGSSVSKTGLYALDNYHKPLAITQPEQTTALVAQETAAYCKTKVIHFYVMDIPHGLTYTGVKTYVDVTAAMDTSYACAYWPNLEILHPNNGVKVQIHPSGSIVGQWSRVSGVLGQGPWQVGAGTDYGILNQVVGLEKSLVNGKLIIPTTDDDIITALQKSKVNSIIIDENYGTLLWGSLTMDRLPKGDINAYTHINQRRVFILVEASFKIAFRRTLFRNNNYETRDDVSRKANNFLEQLHNKGAFPFASKTDNYLVVCNNTNNNSTTSLEDLNMKVELAKHTPINRIKMFFSGKVQQEAA